MPIALAHGLALAALSALPLQGAGAEPQVIVLLEAGQEAELLDVVRERPDEVREALANLFQLSAQSPRSQERVQRILQAEQLARLYERGWSDSFFVSGVEQFRRWSTDERAAKLEADSLRRTGAEAFYGEGPEAAIRIWERSLGQYRAVDDLAGQAAALGNLGVGYYAMGRLERALRHHTRSLELAEAAGDHRTRGNALGNIASVYKDQGEYALAAEFYGRALEVRPLSGDRRGEAADLNNLGLVRSDLGDLQGAQDHFRRALALNRRGDRAREAADNLTNLANVGTKRGQYDGALELYEEALSARRDTGDRRGEALDLENIGLLHLRWGDYPAALRSLDEALAILSEVGPPTWRAEVRSDIAAVQAAMGNLRAALEALDRAESEAEADEYLAADLALQRADLLADLNDFEPAVEFYRKAKAGYARLLDPAGEAEAEQGLGRLYLARGDYNAAEESFTQALAVQESLDDARPGALTRVLLGDVQSLRGDTSLARESYNRALATHQALGDVAAEAATLGALADLERDMGAFQTAADGYRAALDRLEGKPILSIRWHLHLGLGLALRAQGELEGAAAELRSAIAQVETVGGTFPVEERRYGYLEDKWSAYAELAKTELAQGEVAAAFETSERMRARQLVDLLARGRTRIASADPELIQEERNLRQRIGELTDDLRESLDGVSDLRGPTETNRERDGVRQSLVAARAQYQRLLVELRESSPDYASLVAGSTAAVADVQDLLSADAVLIEYLVHDDWTAAFVLRRGEVTAVELPVNRSTLRQLVELFRGTMRRAPSTDDDLWRTPLRRLYRDLIAPLEEAGVLDNARTLIIASHAELHYLPFQALLRPGPAGETFLIESFDVAYIPSASVLLQVVRRSRNSPGRGLLALAPEPTRLSHSRDEVERISLGQRPAQVLVGREATEARFTELAPGRAILHLATFGELNSRNPLFSYVRLSPDGASDGRLEVHEVFGLRLAAELVVLSACETGLATGLRQDVPPGDDWVGLVQAFLTAGAQNVVASLWSVEDRATAQLMEKFYAGLRAGRSKSAALAEAQRELLRESTHAHPFYWAAFASTGGIQ